MAEAARDPFGIVGTVVGGKFRVEAVVGEGGFGVVYRGRHEGFDVPIALKCLKVPAHFDAGDEARLLGELKAEGRLLLVLSQRTSTVVQALDTGSFTTSTGAVVPFLVLEWLEGRTLTAELRARRDAQAAPPSLKGALALLRPAFEALGVAHAEGIAHRDIKPENLMIVTVGKAESLKILDFGIAKILERVTPAEDARTSANAPVFTPAYGAPEQFEKARGATGPWTDVFALALVFVEVVTGRRAMRGEQLIDFYRASTDPVARPSFAAAGLTAPAAVESVMARALSVEPKDRFPDAGAFLAALTEAIEASDAITRAPDRPHVEADGAMSTTAFASDAGLSVAAARSAPSDGSLATASTERAEPGELPRASPPGVATTKGGVVVDDRTGPPASPDVSPPETPDRGLGRWWIAAGALAIGVSAVFALRSRGSSPESERAAASSTGSAGVAPADSADVRPRSTPEAETLFKEAMEAWRGGAPESAVRAMDQAVGLDRGFAAAHLRLALWTFSRRPDDARQHFDLAKRHAANLSPRDLGLLDATEALVSAPSNQLAFAQKLDALTKANPDAPELFAFLGSAELRLHRFDRVLAATDRVLAMDPEHVGSWVLKGEAQAALGDSDGQLATYQACLEKVPRALECLSKKVSLRAVAGQCDEMLADAKRYVQMDPTSWGANRLLGLALLATDGPRESALDALQKSWARRDERDRAAVESGDRAALAILDGDFEAALAATVQWSEAVSAAPDQTSHARPALLAARIQFEIGHGDRASARADDFLRHMGAWTEPSEGDWTLPFLRVRLLAGDLPRAEFEKSRDEWERRVRDSWKRSGRDESGELAWTTWLTAFGAVAEDPGDAAAALAAAPTDKSALDNGKYAAIDYHYGKVLVLGGRATDAIPFLERAGRTCALLTDPLTDTSTHHYLGLAYHAAGRDDDAKAQFELVVRRWGGATPPSRTAEEAKRRLSALARP